jgi:import receptor subunit TOM20
MDRGSTIFTVAAVAIAAGLTAYAVYFDYKRRNDVVFRKKLSKSLIFSSCFFLTGSHIEKDRKRVKQSLAQDDGQAEALDATHAALKEALQVIKREDKPKSNEEIESYFMTQVGIGEQLAAQGPYLPFFYSNTCSSYYLS